VEIKGRSDLPYTVAIRQFDDGDNASKPFDLKISARAGEKFTTHLMSVDQCNNVNLIQQSHDIYIFYERLDLREFSNFRSNDSIPRAHLCDIANEECRKMADFFKEGGIASHQLCSG
jgi:hypothetical protein